MKVANSYSSLVRGVSQQNPQDRLPGQHTEQVNMIPDPVAGLARRHGSKLIAEQQIAVAAEYAGAVADSDSWRTFQYTDAGKDYAVIYRTASNPSAISDIHVFNVTDGAWLPSSSHASDTTVGARIRSGVSAITAVGKYVLMATRDATASSVSTDKWAAVGNRSKAVLWVRGGAYSRRFKVSAKRLSTGVTVNFEYTTPVSAYQGTLDTSNIPLYALDPAGGTQTDHEALWIKEDGTATLTWGTWSPTALVIKADTVIMTNSFPAAPAAGQYSWSAGETVTFHSSAVGATNITATYTHSKTINNPQYSSQVAQATSSYNSAVTAWIGTAATAIQPANIAESLRLAAVAAGLTATRVDSAVTLDDVVDLTVTDSGDNSLIKGTGVQVAVVADLTAYHIPGKIVKVQARSSDDAVYYRAVAKDGTTTTLAEVVWEEAAGTEHAVDLKLILGRVEAGTFYFASTAAYMNLLTGGTDAPTYAKNATGDIDSVPLPVFVGKVITSLAVFQDRLIVGAAGVLRASKIGDYFNFFRSSLLTVLADDAFEVAARGQEDDEMRYPVIYDRDLVIFARDRQYAISGRSPLASTGANLAVISSHKGAAIVPPVAAGALVFYAKQSDTAFSAHQLQPGQVAESPESFLVSGQLDSYLGGSVIELTTVAKPAMLIARSTAKRNSLYVFNYIDATDGRKQDAWHRWDYPSCAIIGTLDTKDGLLVFSLRSNGTHTWRVADLQPLSARLSSAPYLDSWRPWTSVTGGLGIIKTTGPTGVSVAFNDETQYRFLGDSLARASTLLTTFPAATGLVAGFDSPAYVTPTNPFVRDRNDKAITSGQLTITTMTPTCVNSGGIVYDLTTDEVTTTEVFNGRILGNVSNIIGVEPVVTGQVSLPVMAETREFTLTLKSRQWFPFTLSSLEWVGQFFNRTQRV